jgi:hypothetical protein
MRGGGWLILALLVACRAPPPTAPTVAVAPDASVVERAERPVDGGAQLAQTPPDGGSDAPPPRSSEIQAWIDKETARCLAAGPQGIKSVRPCTDGPPTVTAAEMTACGLACIEAVNPSELSPSERAVYQQGLAACIALVDQSLGRGDFRCHFRDPIRNLRWVGDPYQKCDSECRNYAAEVRAQWAPR